MLMVCGVGFHYSYQASCPSMYGFSHIFFPVSLIQPSICSRTVKTAFILCFILASPGQPPHQQVGPLVRERVGRKRGQSRPRGAVASRRLPVQGRGGADGRGDGGEARLDGPGQAVRRLGYLLRVVRGAFHEELLCLCFLLHQVGQQTFYTRTVFSTWHPSSLMHLSHLSNNLAKICRKLFSERALSDPCTAVKSSWIS